MSTPPSWTGHCFCAAVQYKASGAPLNVSLCHCEDCRRASGAPYQGWVFFAKASVEFVSGNMRKHCYEGRERSFCADCGSPIAFTDAQFPDLMELTLGTMDDAACLPPTDYNWMADHLPWVTLDPTLPQFIHNGPAPCLS